jgi:pimeloyl-ACP methyl ester carboxylesterase
MKPPPATPPKEEKAEPEQSLLKKDPLLEIFAEDIQKLLGKHVDISSSDYEKLKSEVAKTDPVAVTTVCRNVHTYRELMGIEIPTLILTGIQDTLMKLSDEKLREQLRTRKQLALVEFEGIRHFPMLEDTAKFTRLLRDFMELPDVENLQVKEEWRRRTR